VREPRRERKVVIVVFADLVGFTARAETMDPEDGALAFYRPAGATRYIREAEALVRESA
jgi:class 3 adenylate cyclase